MLLLALDTSTPATSVAVLDLAGAQPRTLDERAETAAGRSGERVAPLIDAALRAVGVRATELAAVAVGIGPGPFTGLRVGLASASALADAAALPCHGVCSLDALAADHPGAVTVVTDARRREVYWATYAATGERVAGPAVSFPAALAERLGPGAAVAGAGALAYRSEFGSARLIGSFPYPRAAQVGMLAAEDVRSGRPAPPLRPLYLRQPDAAPPGPSRAVSGAGRR